MSLLNFNDKVEDVIKMIPKFIGYTLFTLIMLMASWYVAMYIFNHDFVQNNNIVTIVIFCFVLSVFLLLISVIEHIMWKMDYKGNAILLDTKTVNRIFLLSCYWSIMNFGFVIGLMYLSQYYISYHFFGKYYSVVGFTEFTSVAFGLSILNLAVGSIVYIIKLVAYNAKTYYKRKRIRDKK